MGGEKRKGRERWVREVKYERARIIGKRIRRIESGRGQLLARPQTEINRNTLAIEGDNTLEKHIGQLNHFLLTILFIFILRTLPNS